MAGHWSVGNCTYKTRAWKQGYLGNDLFFKYEFFFPKPLMGNLWKLPYYLKIGDLKVRMLPNLGFSVSAHHFHICIISSLILPSVWPSQWNLPRLPILQTCRCTTLKIFSAVLYLAGRKVFVQSLDFTLWISAYGVIVAALYPLSIMSRNYITSSVCDLALSCCSFPCFPWLLFVWGVGVGITS